MKLKYSRPIPNRKQFNEPANSPVTLSYMDPAEMIAITDHLIANGKGD